MGRKAHANYIEAALKVFEDVGPGPISTKTLVAMAQEKGLVGNGKWVYHNFSRKVRESDLFDTSVRGQIKLVAMPAEEPTTDSYSEASTEYGDTAVEEKETAVEQPVFPGPTLGSGFGN